MSIYDLSPDL